MITRRNFLAALSCLPVIGKWVPKAGGKMFVIPRTTSITMTLPSPPPGLTFHKDAFALVMKPLDLPRYDVIYGVSRPNNALASQTHTGPSEDGRATRAEKPTAT